MPQQTTKLREQILRTGNGRFFYARIHEDSWREYFITLAVATTFKGEDQQSGGIVFNAEELKSVCEMLRAYAEGFDNKTLTTTFPQQKDLDEWLSLSRGSRNFFHVAERKNGELLLIISRRPQPGGTKKKVGVFRSEVEQLIDFLEEHAAALETLAKGDLPEGFPTSAEVIEVLRFEGGADESEDEEYSEEEQELLDRCEDYPGLLELAEERIRHARRLDLLETATDDLELDRLRMIADKLENEAQNPHSRRPDVVYAERENKVREIKIRRDELPIVIEEEIDSLRIRIGEIDEILSQEWEKEQSFRSQRDDPDGGCGEEDESDEER